MRTLSLLASIIVATVSITLFLFRDQISEASNNKTVANLLARLRAYNKLSTASLDEALLQTHPLDLPPGTHLTVTNMSLPRAIRKVFLAPEQAEGVGARVRRSVGTPQLRNFSPFLMLDHCSIRPAPASPTTPIGAKRPSLTSSRAVWTTRISQEIKGAFPLAIYSS